MTTEPETSGPRRHRRWRFFTIGPTFVITLAIFFTLKATSLNGLPEIAEPFDIEAFARPIPDETNAFVLYKQAFAKLGTEPVRNTYVWSAADSEQRRWLDDNREALEIWKRGTARPDALYFPIKQMDVNTQLVVIQGMRSFARLATLEATRLEEQGDLNGSLDWYLAILRSSRHCGRRGITIERLVGIALAGMATTRLLNWAVDPKVDAKMLRRALDGVLEAQAMTPPNSDLFKCEYIWLMNTMADPAFENPASMDANVSSIWKTGPGEVYFKVARSLKREPERSRRVLRLVIANALAYCDRPRTQRPPFANLTPPARAGAPPVKPSGLMLYIPEPSASPSLKALTPEQLNSWFDSTIYAEMLLTNSTSMDQALKRDESNFASLQIRLATELFAKEKGRYPEADAELVGPYLSKPPDGYQPSDPTKETRPVQ